MFEVTVVIPAEIAACTDTADSNSGIAVVAFAPHISENEPPRANGPTASSYVSFFVDDPSCNFVKDISLAVGVTVNVSAYTIGLRTSLTTC